MSTWLSHFLYTKEKPCYHEKSQEFSSADSIAQFLLEKDCGFADTGLLLHWDKFIKYPVTTILIEKNPEEVWKELERIGLPLPHKTKEAYVKATNEYFGPRISFEEVVTESGMRKLCFTLGVDFDEVKYEEFKDTQIQPFVPQMIERAKKNLNTCQDFYKEFI
jgi:hypothetical protein